MATDNLIAKLYESPKTILTTKDIALIWGETNTVNLLSKIKYYANRGSLIRLTRGVFAKNRAYDVKELATSIYTPSYISFETVLREAGIIFQHHESIFVAGPYPITKKIGNQAIVFRKLKWCVLYNALGIKHEKNYSIATPERAFLDTIYLSPQFYFDNLRSINWEQCFALAKIYDNKQLIKRIKKYQTNYQKHDQ
jgi:predicted transcriptional regulator of viral defense system